VVGEKKNRLLVNTASKFIPNEGALQRNVLLKYNCF